MSAVGSHLLYLATILFVPLLALFIEIRGDDGIIIERHHSHHDIYLAPRAVTVSLMLMLLFVGVLGLVVGWLCDVGVYDADGELVDAFFVTFIVVVFVLWLGVRRYRVVTYDNRVVVRNLFGKSRSIDYADITAVQRLPRVFGPYHNVRVFAGDKNLFLWGLVDLEQILARINRFDVLSEGRKKKA
jgi:hypothetical protein